jgi:type IV pilus assembly protein PilP
MRILVLIVLMQAVLLTGCLERADKNAEEFIKEVKQEKSEKIPPLPEIQEYKSIDYTASNLRNPFQLSPEFLTDSNKDEKVGTTEIAQQPRPDADRKRELLESYSLDSISMVGTIRKGATFWGIVKDKTGIIHRVHIGNYLGENSGCIEKITENTIFVRETLADGQGGWTERASSLSLAK